MPILARKSNQKNRYAAVITVIMTGLLFIAVVLFFSARMVFPLKYEVDILEQSQLYDTDPFLIMGIIRAESGFREKALSHADAIGLMQITEETGSHIANQLEIQNFSKEQLYDPQTNIQFGIWYIQSLLERFYGELDLALAAYNAGPGTVHKWLEDQTVSPDGRHFAQIPYPETRHFISRVKLYRDIYKILYRVPR